MKRYFLGVLTGIVLASVPVIAFDNQFPDPFRQSLMQQQLDQARERQNIMGGRTPLGNPRPGHSPC